MQPPDPSPPTTPLARLGAWCVRRRRRVVGGWILAIIVAIAAMVSLGGDPAATFETPGSESQAVTQLLERHFPDRSPDAIDVVWASDSGADHPQNRAVIDGLLERASTLPGVGVALPPEFSGDGRIGVARLQIDGANMDDVPTASAEGLIAMAREAEGDGLQVELGGQVIADAEGAEPSPEAVGLLLALVILVLTFGSLVAAGLPIMSAVAAMAIVTSLVAVLAAVIDTPDFATPVAIMIGLGVGIDYALLLITRYRAERSAGHAGPVAVHIATATAGRSVVVAALTVVVAMLGLTTLGLSFMSAVAISAAISVVVAAAAALTLLPAVLGAMGDHVDRLRVPGLRPRTGHSPRWERWSGAVQRRPGAAVCLALAVTIVLAAPVTTFRLGFPDAGNNAASSTTRVAYDLMSEGFGPGGNGPLIVVAETPPGTDPAAGTRMRSILDTTNGVAATGPAWTSPDGRATLVVVTPAGSPQSEATSDLVHALRSDAAPAVASATGLDMSVGGATAGVIDSSDHLADRLPLLIGVVVGLSMLLLVVAFRSVAIAVKAALMNIASIGAAYGVVALVAQGGWAGRLVGIDTEVPVPPFVPVMMFAILFGLSMDYEVFLLSRIRERYLAHGDTTRAVTEGLASTGAVITAAAAIMIGVFAAFALSAPLFLKLFAVGMAAAIVVDATIVRILLVPALMQLLGRANWWLPRWLDRALPRVDLEGAR